MHKSTGGDIIYAGICKSLYKIGKALLLFISCQGGSWYFKKLCTFNVISPELESLSQNHGHCQSTFIYLFFPPFWDIHKAFTTSQKESFLQKCAWKNLLEIAEEQVTVFKAENTGFENMNPSDLLNLAQWIPELWNMGPGCACHIGAIRLAVGWLWHGLFQTPSQCPVLHVPRWHLVGRSWASKAGNLECSPLCFDKHIIDHLITSLRSALRSLGDLDFQ